MLGLVPRRVLTGLAALAAAGVIAACGDDGPVVFTHGVASGDVRPDGAVLWTRADREATLTVEVATDQAFTDVAAEQEVRTEGERDFTANVAVSGLQPGTEYFYRFRRNEDLSDVGVFHTAPAADDAAPVRFIFSGDSDGTVREDGTRAFDFKVLDTARAEEADFFVYFGDTIYADSSLGAKAATLEAYRAKYKENREVAPLAHILAATSVYTVWDDHEVENDFDGTGVDPDLLAAGRQAFREYMPIGGDERPEVLYRRFRWGKAVEVFILDERSFRGADAEEACTAQGQEEPDLLPGLGAANVPQPYRAFRSFIQLPDRTAQACLTALNDPKRTMLGEEQKEFLLQALEESEATFKFIVNEVPIAELIALPYDRWEGYRAERDEILGFIKEHGIRNVVFLTTDFHANIVSEVRLNAIGELAAKRPPPPVAVEFVTGPIAHETLGDAIARTQGAELLGAFEALLKQVPQAECVQLDAFSYGLVEVDPKAGSATVTLKDETGRKLCQKVLKAG